MRFLDLFAGVGGIRLGMEQAGHKCVGWVEWDKFARKSYISIHQPTDEYTEKDVNDIKASDLPISDCWCFGFPCQDISVAGKQGGFTNGKRSSLFFKVTGLIRELKEEDRPSYLFIENVKNLLSINKGWDFAKLQIELDEIGYDVEWDVLDSAEVVPQHRERIFIIGHLRGRGTRKVFPISRQGRKTSNEIKEITKVNKNRHSSEGNSVLDTNGLGQTISATSFKHVMKVAINQVGNISNSKSYNGNPQVGRVYGTDGIAPTLSTMQGGGQEPKIAVAKKRFGRLGIQAVETFNYKRPKYGDTIDPYNKRIRTDGNTNTITTRPEGLKTAILPVTQDMRIRKLIPLECWRLQGFPDWAFERAKQAGLSDSQLYKQAGNSVTVPVIKAIAKNMEMY
ncbi:DNA methyltransferase [Lactobacillus phage Lenus]|uniref:Modification methylase n=1 Tax=Lactobacillus phage Lenus TaxID=2053682 RepID=A0A2H4PBE1_9CAUD|nr:DNA methyltransferase [Lactobacillus phage Lenus]ATW59490.1 modification methylase [Lactobacillus phage Lenus]